MMTTTNLVLRWNRLDRSSEIALGLLAVASSRTCVQGGRCRIVYSSNAFIGPISLLQKVPEGIRGTTRSLGPEAEQAD
jgi:hypothetical protein